MPHSTVTISEEAYRRLAKLKRGKESFTDVILRLTSERGTASALLNYVVNMPPSEELATNIKAAMKITRRARMGRAVFD